MAGRCWSNLTFAEIINKKPSVCIINGVTAEITVIESGQLVEIFHPGIEGGKLELTKSELCSCCPAQHGISEFISLSHFVYSTRRFG